MSLQMILQRWSSAANVVRSSKSRFSLVGMHRKHIRGRAKTMRGRWPSSKKEHTKERLESKPLSGSWRQQAYVLNKTGLLSQELRRKCLQAVLQLFQSTSRLRLRKIKLSKLAQLDRNWLAKAVCTCSLRLNQLISFSSKSKYFTNFNLVQIILILISSF